MTLADRVVVMTRGPHRTNSPAPQELYLRPAHPSRVAASKKKSPPPGHEFLPCEFVFENGRPGPCAPWRSGRTTPSRSRRPERFQPVFFSSVKQLLAGNAPEHCPPGRHRQPGGPDGSQASLAKPRSPMETLCIPLMGGTPVRGAPLDRQSPRPPCIAGRPSQHSTL